MSKRLQVLLDEQDWREIKRAARAQRMTVSAWVRQALRAVRQEEPGIPADRKLRAVREATQFNFPTGDIDQMLGEIEHSHTDDSA